MSAGFLGVARIPVLRGRGLTATDWDSGEAIGVVSRGFADRAAEDPLDQLVRLGLESTRVVGVVADVPIFPEQDQFAVYRPYTGDVNLVIQMLAGESPVQVVARFDGGVSTERLAVLASIPKAVDPSFRVLRSQSVRALRVGLLGASGLASVVLVVFAAAGLLLTVVGVVGHISDTTAREAQPNAIRVALGADPALVVWQVARRTGIAAAAGIGAGLLFGLAARPGDRKPPPLGRDRRPLPLSGTGGPRRAPDGGGGSLGRTESRSQQSLGAPPIALSGPTPPHRRGRTGRIRQARRKRRSPGVPGASAGAPPRSGIPDQIGETDKSGPQPLTSARRRDEYRGERGTHPAQEVPTMEITTGRTIRWIAGLTATALIAAVGYTALRLSSGEEVRRAAEPRDASPQPRVKADGPPGIEQVIAAAAAIAEDTPAGRLVAAARAGNAERVRELLAEGIPPDAEESKNGHRALHPGRRVREDRSRRGAARRGGRS